MRNEKKKIFADAILALSKEQPLENISVTDLINYCHVNRYTFYYHFKNKNDLVSYVIISKTKEIFTSIEDDGQIVSKDALRLLFSHFKENRSFYKSALSDQSSDSMAYAWYNFHLGLYRTMALKALKLQQLDKDTDMAIRFGLGGGIRLVQDWLNNDCQEDVEEIVHYGVLYFSILYNRFVGNVSVARYFGPYTAEQQKAPKEGE